MNTIQDPNWREKAEIIKRIDEASEKAYRRGVDQTLDWVLYQIGFKDVDNFKEYIKTAKMISAEMRREKGEIPAYLHELSQRILIDKKR